MTRQAHDVTREQIEHLCAGYRAGVEEPAFGAADQLLLRAATRSARYRSLQRRLCAPASLALVALLAVLGTVAAGWFDLSGSHPPTPPAAATVTTRAVLAAPPIVIATSATFRAAHTQPSPPPKARLPVQPGYVQTAIQAVTPPVLLTSTSATVRVAELPALPASPAADISAAQSATAPGPTAPGQSGAIDLNGPGALDVLRRTRPEDYRRIVVILAGITRHAQRDVPHWLQTDFDARDIVYQPLWLTSFPPKRRLSFSLEGQRYRAVLTITNQGARVFPVDGTAQCRAPATGVVCGDPALNGQR